MPDYKIKLNVFEGPLDLLLHLVKINEMDISEIPIAEITRQYLDYLRLMETLDLEVAGDFLVMAATLLNIKLRALLPDSTAPEEEAEEVEDILTARALMEKLIQYRRFKEAAAALQERETVQARVFLREVALPRLDQAERDDDMRLELAALLQAFGRVARYVADRPGYVVAEEAYAVEDQMAQIARRIEVEKRLSVEELFGRCGSKLEMIVCLLAILELFHERRLRLEQSGPFAPIYLFEADPEGGADPSAPPEPGPTAAAGEP